MPDQSTLDINWGEGIMPAGGGRAELPFGAFRVRLAKAPFIRASLVKDSKEVVLEATLTCTGVGKGYDPMGENTTITPTLRLPHGDDFSQDSNGGRQNCALVAELKAFLVCFQVPLEKVVALQKNVGPMPLDVLVGREGVVFNEPSIPGKKGDWPEIHYLSPDRGVAAMDGQYKPRLKKGEKAPTAGAAQIDHAGKPPAQYDLAGMGSPDFAKIPPPGAGPSVPDNGTTTKAKTAAATAALASLVDLS